MLRRAPLPVITPFEVVAFDIETTSAEVTDARIVSYSAALVSQHADGLIKAEVLASGIINPGVPMDPEAAAVHGITAAVAAVGMEPGAALQQLTHVLKSTSEAFNIPVCAFNARFDLTVLTNELDRHQLDTAWLLGTPVVDPMILDRRFDPRRPGSRRLGLVCRHYGVPLEAAHDPTADAVAAAGVFFKLLNKFQRLRTLSASVAELHHAQVTWAAEQAASLQAHLREKGSDPTVTIDSSWPFFTRPTA